MLQIVEIIEPAEQGFTTPYLCRGEDDRLYYVKGRNAGRRSQWCEWLAGHLGHALGLPIPPFRIVDVPAELLPELPTEWRHIGAGPAFASEAQGMLQWSEPATVALVPQALRRSVLMFDWWIRNMDRTDGNPNLLWDGGARRLMVIDHNLAFDRDFSPASFCDLHVFRGDWGAIFGDLVERAEWRNRLAAVLSVWQDACNNVPLEWRWANDEQDVPVDFDPDTAHETLSRYLIDDFWRMV